MNQSKNGFTLVEVIIVIAVLLIVGIVLAVVFVPGWVQKKRAKQQMVMCNNNLRQMGIGLMQYEMTYNNGPAYNLAGTITTTDGDLCEANLLMLLVSELVADKMTFICPKRSDGEMLPSYNLTTCYNQGDPVNKIVIADMPFAKGNVTASIHDADADTMNIGPNCLFKDGHVANFQDLCPQGSSEYDLSPNGNIYRVDSGNGKGKDTCILGLGR